MPAYPGRPSARQRGYTTRWDKARKTYIHAHPVCVMCLKAGRYTQAKVVDHIIPHKGDQRLFWDQDNWQSLCAQHHSLDKQRIERGGKARQDVDESGWPIG